jgi:thiol-disulfide isomerase/thioredoxin
MKKKIIFILLIVLSIIIISSSWYLFQSRNIIAPDFSLTDLDGNPFRLSDFKGKIVIIDFMDVWCLPCRQQIPHLKVIWEKEDYRNKIVLLSIEVNVVIPEEILKDFRQEFPYATWIWAKDKANESIASLYQVSYIPKIVIIDQYGYIRFVHTGLTDSSILIQEIDKLLT